MTTLRGANPSPDVLVIGAGVVGLSTALYLARKGHRVTVIDRSSPDHQGCSYGNAGMIVPSHFIPLAAPGVVKMGLKWMFNPASPFYLKPRLDPDLLGWVWRFWRASNARRASRAAPLLRDLHLASRQCYREWANWLGADFGLVETGLLTLCRTAEGLAHEAEVAEQARQMGIVAELLTPRQAAELDPSLQMSIAGAVYCPQDCHLSPPRLMAALKNHLPELGVELRWDTEMTGWRRRASRIEAVRTSQGDLPADEFVLCSGSWSAGLARSLGLRLPLQAGKGYSLTLPNPPRLPRVAAILSEARVAVTPMGSSLRFAGTLELAGLDQTINPVRVRAIQEAVGRYYPEFSTAHFEGVQPWCGLRPCSPDGLPYLGRTRRCNNLLLAAGHAMMGLSLGPISGRLVAQVLSDEPPSLDLSLLDPDRYA